MAFIGQLWNYHRIPKVARDLKWKHLNPLAFSPVKGILVAILRGPRTVCSKHILSTNVVLEKRNY